jgi:uncharacterized protein YicC (UPF0701 family)
VRRVAARGKVNVVVEYAPAGGRDEPAWNEAAVGAALDRLAGPGGRAQDPLSSRRPELLWQVANALRSPSLSARCRPRAPGAHARARRGAAGGFAAMRAREGEALFVDFIERVGTCRRQVDAVAARAPAVAPAYREQLLKRLRDAGLELDVDDERVLREIALFADRCDITEEITRFRSHLDQLSALLKSDGEIGRKADFILQEMGREANTIGSKANDLAISKSVIELKNELERIREQMANVE